MRGKIILALFVVGIVLSLAFVRVDVPSINSHDGAVAYTQPVIKSNYTAMAASSGGIISDSEPSISFGANSISTTIEIVSHKYTAPTPKTRPLWEAIIESETLFSGLNPLPASNQTTGIQPVGPTCQQGIVTTTTFDVTTYAVIDVLEPGGKTTSYSTDPVTWTVTHTRTTYTCSDGSNKIQITDKSGTVTYNVGTYYYTHGFGDYRFTVTIMMKPATGADFRTGQVVQAVGLTEGSLK
jgi:hypothetical protein